MTRNEAINYLRSSGMSDDQIKAVSDAFTSEELNAYSYKCGLKDGLRFARLIIEHENEKVEE